MLKISGQNSSYSYRLITGMLWDFPSKWKLSTLPYSKKFVLLCLFYNQTELPVDRNERERLVIFKVWTILPFMSIWPNLYHNPSTIHEFQDKSLQSDCCVHAVLATFQRDVFAAYPAPVLKNPTSTVLFKQC